ncbi:MAG: endonuclease III [Candidatus Aenigmarchaeota archaeon]|nr:endonuclease III [Candidatus Aenigmarchaeota archaeon]
MKKVDIDSIYKILKKHVTNYQLPAVDLVAKTKDPFKVLVATILSARTNDKTTIAAAGRLFSKIHKLNDLKNLSSKKIEKIIYPVSFYRNKAKYLKRLPSEIKIMFNGKIPKDVNGLVKLSGVGRKTANLVSSVAFGKQAICVDTHVHRVMNRIGYVKTKTPFETEMALRKKLPKKYWIHINTLLVRFGQNLCRPISPFCTKCPIKKYCNKIGVKRSR